MSTATLDPKAALLLIDLQRGIVTQPMAHPTDDIITRAASLATAARHSEIPVVLVNVAGGAAGRTERPQPTVEPPATWSAKSAMTLVGPASSR